MSQTYELPSINHLNYRIEGGSFVEALEREARAGRTLEGAHLQNRDLRNAGLSGADLRSVALTGADLSCADLSRADLTYAGLRRARLEDTDLSGATLEGAELCGADMRGANLAGARLGGADLSEADLTGANLTGADLAGVMLWGTRGSAGILDKYRDDLWTLCDEQPERVDGLLGAVYAGEIDTSVYKFKCACLAGSAECECAPFESEGDKDRLAAKWFAYIGTYARPGTDSRAELAAEWIEEWQARRGSRGT